MLDDLPLFNQPTAPHNNTDTSKEAGESIKPEINALCRRVLNAIKQMPGGLTCDECEVILGLKHQTCSARINDLSTSQPPSIVNVTLEDGSKLKRKTRSGRKAFVWVAAE